MALESKDADDRRQGVIGLSQRDYETIPWAGKVFDTVARTDTDPMVRCAAIRALARAPKLDCLPTILKLLGDNAPGLPDARPATGHVRWEAAKLLLLVLQECEVDSAQRDAIVRVLLDRLARDDSRNVRLTVIDALAFFPRRPVPSALVDVMQTERTDFAMQHAIEESLIVLTGTMHGHDATAWRRWLASEKDPFKCAGETPEGREPKPEKRWWQ